MEFTSARTGHQVWNAEDGPEIASEQKVPADSEILADGTVVGRLWTPSEGPCGVDPGGGAGGGPDGYAIPIQKVVWD